jgi:cell division protein FtsB
MDLQNIMTFYDEKISDRKQIEVIQSRLDELIKENNKLKQEIKTIKTIYNHG